MRLTLPQPCIRIATLSTAFLLNVIGLTATSHTQCVGLVMALTKTGCSLGLEQQQHICLFVFIKTTIFNEEIKIIQVSPRT